MTKLEIKMNTTNDKLEALWLAEQLEEHNRLLFEHGKLHAQCLPESAALLRSQHAEIQRLTAELEEVRKDAERYQWLREQAPDNMDVDAAFRLPTCERFDAAIDAAMGASHV